MLLGKGSEWPVANAARNAAESSAFSRPKKHLSGESSGHARPTPHVDALISVSATKWPQWPGDKLG